MHENIRVGIEISEAVAIRNVTEKRNMADAPALALMAEPVEFDSGAGDDHAKFARVEDVD
jgi:hypothetical protein